MRRSKRSTSVLEELRRAAARRVMPRMASTSSPHDGVRCSFEPHGVEVVPAGAQGLGQRLLGRLQARGAQGVLEDGGAQRLPLAAARVHEQGAPEVERDGPQHGPRVPDGIRPPTAASPCEGAAAAVERPTRRAARRGVRHSAAAAPSRAAQTAGDGRSTSMRLRSMLPQAGHISDRVSRGAPSGVRKRWRHSPHSYSLLPGIVVLPSSKPRLYSYPFEYRFVSRVNARCPCGVQ